MSILKRIKDIALASVNDALDKAECPISMIKQYIRNVEEEISRAEHGVSRQVALEKRQELLVQETKDLIAKRERQAKLALDTGDDAMARLAVQEKLLHEKRLVEYTAQYEAIREHTARLGDQLKELREKYNDMQAKKRVLISRANAAHGVKRMSDALTVLDTESAAKGFARMEERISMMEVDAEVSKRIRSIYGTTHSQLDTAAQELEAEVEKELAKLKKAE